MAHTVTVSTCRSCKGSHRVTPSKVTVPQKGGAIVQFVCPSSGKGTSTIVKLDAVSAFGLGKGESWTPDCPPTPPKKRRSRAAGDAMPRRGKAGETTVSLDTYKFTIQGQPVMEVSERVTYDIVEGLLRGLVLGAVSPQAVSSVQTEAAAVLAKVRQQETSQSEADSAEHKFGRLLADVLWAVLANNGISAKDWAALYPARLAADPTFAAPEAGALSWLWGESSAPADGAGPPTIGGSGGFGPLFDGLFGGSDQAGGMDPTAAALAARLAGAAMGV